MCLPVDSSSFGSSASLPFPDKLSNTLSLARGQIDQDSKDGRAIQKVQGPISWGGRRPKRAACEGGAPTAPPPPAASGLHFVNI